MSSYIYQWTDVFISFYTCLCSVNGKCMAYYYVQTIRLGENENMTC